MWGFGKKSGASRQKTTLDAERDGDAKEIAFLESKIAVYNADKRASYFDLEQSKDELESLQEALIAKKQEIDRASGVRKQILIGEYEILAKNFERKKGEPALIQAKIKQFDALIVSAEQAIHMLRSPSVEQDAEKIGEVHNDGTVKLENDEFAVHELEANLFPASQNEEFDVEAHYAKLVGEAEQKPRVS